MKQRGVKQQELEAVPAQEVLQDTSAPVMALQEVDIHPVVLAVVAALMVHHPL